ncbi:phage tail tape measure protein [Mycetocola saprophilus]|uniref:phage tail tape measure protein n=1 Tax=Mycetocola saprophilus TaxID=76636 RepID=UPI003BF44C0C
MSSDRVVKVTLKAAVNEYLAGMEAAHRATAKNATEAEKAATKLQAQSDMMDKGGKALMVAGAAALAATALSVKAAIDWESAWTGVLKTVDGTPAQLGAVEDGLRSLARQLPTTHTEIGAVAEAAGQLGVATGDVRSFTKVMIDLGESTNMVAVDAATELARFMNVMGTAPDKVSNLGAAVVGLGNNFATTESEIVAMAQRLSGAGVQIGLTEGEVLGLSTSLSSVGIEAEAGGSAVSKVMINIASAVDSGSGALSDFAEIAGMSADEFASKWKSAPGEALAAFVKGLANAESQGKTTLGMLEDLGIKEVRMRDALLRSAAAADNFAGAMQMGNTEFEANNALLDEATKRYATAESKIAIMGNRVNDAAISFGQGLLPMVSASTDAVGNFADGLGSLPGWLQGTISVLTAVGGGIALISGATLIGLPKIAAFNNSLADMGIKAQVSARGIAIAAGTIGGVLAIATAALAAFGAAQADARAKAEAFGNTLDAQTGQITKASRELAVTNLSTKESFMWMESDSTLDAAQKLGISLELVTNAALGSATAAKELDDALGNWSVGDPQYQEALKRTGLNAQEYALALSQVRVGVQDSSDAVERAQETQKLMQGATEKATEATVDNAAELKALSGAAQNASFDIEALSDAIQGFGKTELDARAAARQLEQAFADLRKSVQDHGRTLDITTEAGRKNEQSIDAVAKAAIANSTAILNQTGSQEKATAAMEAGRQKLMEMLKPFGITGEAADQYVRKLGLIPENIATGVKLTGLGEVESQLSHATRARQVQIEAIYDQKLTPSVGHSTKFANGGVVDFYANGGVRENHVAQIAPAGAWRVWAEPETEGEAYIPFAQSKRARSLQIYAEVGRRLGVTEYADGGVNANAYAATARSAAPVVVVPAVSLQGAVLSATIDGRPIEVMIDSQIARRDNETARIAGLGFRS